MGETTQKVRSQDLTPTFPQRFPSPLLSDRKPANRTACVFLLLPVFQNTDTGFCGKLELTHQEEPFPACCLFVLLGETMKKLALPFFLAGVFNLAASALFLLLCPTGAVGQPPSRVEERQAERGRMVEQQIASRGVTSEAVLKALRAVPRHLFVPEDQRRYAYLDCPLPIGYGQTISQPFIVAYMTEVLDLEPGDKALEIGTGSGYQAAVLARMGAKVFTVEIIEALGEQAMERLRETGCNSVNVRIGDGYYGWEEHAPFDAIIVTAAAGHVPPPLLKQLKPGGTMVIPIGSPYQIQTLMKVIKSESGELSTRSLMPVSFVPMTGRVLEK